MKPSVDIITDLYPLYIMNKISQDSRALIENFAKEYPQDFDVIENAYTEFNTMKHEIEKSAFIETKKKLNSRSLYLGLFLFCFFSGFSFTFGSKGFYTLMGSFPLISYSFLLLAVIFLGLYIKNRKLIKQ